MPDTLGFCQWWKQLPEAVTNKCRKNEKRSKDKKLNKGKEAKHVHFVNLKIKRNS